MRKMSKRLVAFATMVCVTMAMAVPIAAKESSLEVSGVTYELKADKTSPSGASYYEVKFSIEQLGGTIANSMTAAPIWRESGSTTYVQGRTASGTNVSKISGTDSKSPASSYSGCFVTFVVKKGTKTGQNSITVF